MPFYCDMKTCLYAKYRESIADKSWEKHDVNLKAKIYCGRFLWKTCMKETKGKAADPTKEEYGL